MNSQTHRYLTTADLIARGWTRYRITKLLVPHHKYVRSCWHGPYEVNYYAAEDVEVVSASRAKGTSLVDIETVYTKPQILKAARATSYFATKKDRLTAYRQALGTPRLRQPHALDQRIKGLLSTWFSACALRSRLRAAWDAGCARQAQAVEQAEVDAINVLSDEIILRRATYYLHALNRAAKHVRGTVEAKRIYAAKDLYLTALVRARKATLGSFQREQESSSHTCRNCSNQWYGSDHCYNCDDNTGCAELELVTWYVVDCGGGCRFHQPRVAFDLQHLATPIVPHNPNQPERRIPFVSVGRRAQLRLVERAAALLTRGRST